MYTNAKIKYLQKLSSDSVHDKPRVLPENMSDRSILYVYTMYRGIE